MKDLKSFYVIYIPGIILTMTTTFAILGYLSVAEYAIVNMYMVYSNYMPFLTFGFQDGMFLKYRRQPLADNANQIKREFTFMIIFQTVIYLIFMLIVFQFDSEYLIYAAIGMLPINLISVGRNILQAANMITEIAIIDLIMRIAMFLAFVVMFMLGKGYQAFIFFDILTKMIILIIFTIYIYVILNKHKNAEQKIQNDSFMTAVIDNFKNGFLVLVGSWVWILLYSIDKVFLSTSVDQNTLGAYAAAMAVISLFITAITPIKTVILSAIDKNIDGVKVSNISRLLNTISIVMATCYLLIAYPIIINFNIVPKYSESFDMILFIVLLLPMILNLQVLLSNIVQVKLYKIYPVLNIGLLIFSCLTYLLAINVTSGVYGVILASVINFLVMEIAYLMLIGDKKENIYVIGSLIVWMVLYVLAVFNLIFMIIYIIFLSAYLLKEFMHRGVYLKAIRG